MGLFDKLFGNTNKEEKTNTRDQYKSEKYFRSEVLRCEKWMENDKEDYALYIKEHGALLPFHYLSSCAIRMDKFSNLYSLGESIDQLKPLYLEALGYFLKGWSEDFQSYNQLLQMSALAVLLEIPDEDCKKLVGFVETADQSKIEDIWKPDSLVFFLTGVKKKRTGSKSSELLYHITRFPNDQAQRELNGYLKKWYDYHKDEAWYGSHTREWGYSGYWAWEVGAVVKLLGLDDNSFKDSPYYPDALVNWKGVPNQVSVQEK